MLLCQSTSYVGDTIFSLFLFFVYVLQRRSRKGQKWESPLSWYYLCVYVYMVKFVQWGMCMFRVCEFREGSVWAHMCELNRKWVCMFCYYEWKLWVEMCDGWCEWRVFMRRVLMVKGVSRDGVNGVYMSFCVCVNGENGVLCMCIFEWRRTKTKKGKKINSLPSLSILCIVYILFSSRCAYSLKK